MDRDLSNKIERLEVFEDRAGVTLQGLSAFIQDHGDDSIYLTVAGELQSRDGTELKQDVSLNIAVYDTAGRVIESQSYSYFQDEFFALETFSYVFSIPVSDISKIRVYPKKGE